MVDTNQDNRADFTGDSRVPGHLAPTLEDVIRAMDNPPPLGRALEKRSVQYAIRITANESLEWEIADLLFRPPGRPSCRPLIRYKSFSYQAGSWARPRRVVAKVEHHAGELFPRVGFIVTNLPLLSRALARFYNRRVTVR